MIALLLTVAVWVAPESEKVRPDARPVAGAPRVHLTAAGGDCAGAQIVVRGPVEGLSATASALQGGAATPVAVALSRVGTLVLAHPSGPEGESGEWPDPLIPARDALYGEARNAFPVDVGAGRAQSIFLEACAPRGGPAQRYEGAVQLAWKTPAGPGGASVPVELRARGFDLPATPALATAFGFSGYTAAKGHHRGVEAARELTFAYDSLALRRGITLFGGTQDAPARTFEGGVARIDWRAYDAEVAPFLDGKGARWTAVELREPGKLDRAQRRAYRRAWVDHFRKRGWLDRLFAYVHDEPAEKDYALVEAKARELREDVPEVRRLVTTTLSEKLPSVDLYVPLVNCIGERGPTCARALPPERYQHLWWYQSCMSHGCSKDGAPVSNPAFRGWPSYMIDAPATAARAMGALAFANGVEGELYFDTVFAYDPAGESGKPAAAGDPWKSQWAFGGNGDGTLYYPGMPERIGGVHDVPVESLRILQIARGLADHAYLALCAQLGDAPLARAEARALAATPRTWSRDPRAYEAMRERISARIEKLLAQRKALAE